MFASLAIENMKSRPSYTENTNVGAGFYQYTEESKIPIISLVIEFLEPDYFWRALKAVINLVISLDISLSSDLRFIRDSQYQ
jgi:hypothetical protein